MADDVPTGPRKRVWPTWVGYAVAAVGAATLARLALDPLLGTSFPFTTYFLTAAVVSAVGQTRTAVLTLISGGLLGVYLFAPPRYSFSLYDPNVLSGLALYLIVGGVVVAMSHAMRTARRRAERLLAVARRAEERLRDADRRKDEFLATLAHELRNPLAPIRTGLHLLGVSGGDPAAAEKVRTMMDRQLTQLVRLVDDLMDVSRISRGRIELRRERVPLAAVVGSAVETSRPLLDQMGHRLTVTLPDEPVFLNADLTRLAQVVMNLLNNAAKYSDRGSDISLTAWRDGRDVVVSVRDAGIGIPPDRLVAIFDLFAQVEHAVGKSQGGLGIGLSLVKRLVEMHGGTIAARSAGPGTGSEFVVRLPAG